MFLTVTHIRWGKREGAIFAILGGFFAKALFSNRNMTGGRGLTGFRSKHGVNKTSVVAQLASKHHGGNTAR